MGKEGAGAAVAIWGYQLISWGTFAYLTAMDAGDFNAWNWLIIIPINLFLGYIWPAYWGILHWVM